MKRLFFGLAGLTAGIVVAAETDVGNLLPDYKLEDAAATWGLVEKPERGHIESFRGLWTPLDYVRVPAGTKFVREIQLETNAFYVLSWTQRGNFSGGLSAASVTGKPPKYGHEPIDRGMTAEGEWTDRKIVRWTNTNANFRVVLKEAQGLAGEIGRIALRKMSDGEAADYAMDDPGFEKSVVGKFPSWGTPLWGCFGVKTVAEGAHSGKKCVKLTANSTSAFSIPGGVARKNDRFEASIWVHLPRPAKITFEVHTCEPGGNMHTVLSRRGKAGWNQMKAGGVARNKHAFFGGPDTDYVTYNAQVGIETEDGKGIEVLLDDWSFRRESPDSVGDVEHPRLANSSFRCGPWGWRIATCMRAEQAIGGDRRVSWCTTDSSDGDGRCLAIRTGRPLLMDSPPYRVRFGGRYTVSFSAKGDRPIKLKTRISSAAETTFDVTNDWRRFSISAVAAPNPIMTGGDWQQVGFEAPADDATLWLDDFRIELEGVPPRQDPLYEAGLWFDEPYAIWNVGEKPREINLAAGVRHGDGRRLSAVFTVTDKDGKTFLRKVLGEVVCKDEERTDWHLVPPQDESGYYHAKLTLADPEGKTVAWNETTYSVLPKPRDLPFAQSGAGILPGSCVDWPSMGGRITMTYGRHGADFGDQLDVLKKMGMKWIRVMGPGSWRIHELKQGEYVWPWHAYLKAIKDRGMGVLIEFDSHDHAPWSRGRDFGKKQLYGKCTYAPKPEDLEAFAERYAREYKGKIDAVNFVNEVGGHPVDTYLELIGALRRGIRKVSPEVIVQGPGMPGDLFPNLSEKSWMAKIYAKGYADVTDVHGIHPYEAGQWQLIDSARAEPIETYIYRQKLGKTEVEVVRDGIADLKAKYPGRPVWDTESGYNFNTVAPWMYSPTEPRQIWYTERVAAARLARWAILRRSAGVEKWIYFSFHCHMFYHGLDICNFDGTPKAGVNALATFWSVLDGSKPEKSKVLDDGTCLEKFVDADGFPVLVFWNPHLENEKPREFALPSGCRVRRVISCEGATIRPAERDGRLVLPLSDEPVYVVGERE